MNWHKLTTEQRLYAIRQAHEPGLSLAQIGAKIGTTKGSIVGYYKRHPDLHKTHPLNKPNTPKARTSDRKPRRVYQNPKPRSTPPIIAEPITVYDPDITTGRPITMMHKNMCRWPVNDAERPDEHLFCGSPGFPYCEAHSKLAYGAGTESERAAIRVLKKHLLR